MCEQIDLCVCFVPVGADLRFSCREGAPSVWGAFGSSVVLLVARYGWLGGLLLERLVNFPGVLAEELA